MCWGPMRDNLWWPTANGKQVAATKHADISICIFIFCIWWTISSISSAVTLCGDFPPDKYGGFQPAVINHLI